MRICFKNVKKNFKDTEFGVIKDFIKFIQSEVPLKKDISIEFLDKRKSVMTTGMRTKNSLFILCKDRLLIDVLRTLSHEWVHEFQHQRLGLKEKTRTRDIGGPEENMANALSGIFLKKFEKDNPKSRKIIYNENKINKIQKLILELSPKSSGVKDFIDKVKDTPGLNEFLDFNSISSLEDYIYDGSQKDFDELREMAEEFDQLTEKEKEYYIEKQNKKKSKKK